MGEDRYLTAREAAGELGISTATLYAYVSRGLIRSEATGGKRRDRRYRAEDVSTLRERKEQRRDPARVARSALDWGTPVMESAITLIADGRVYVQGPRRRRSLRELLPGAGCGVDLDGSHVAR